jgi:L-threonylcarbamoyladenylate synthase
VAEVAAGGQPGIGLRCPAHTVARALLRQAATLGVPGVAAPSANRFGRISPTTAAHVVAEFGATLWVVDGGPCEVGIESAIVDCSRARPVLLRPGVLTRMQLESALGEPLAMVDADAPRAPGTLEAHYAPRAPLRLVDAATLRAVGGATRGVAVYSRTRPALAKGVVWRPMPSDPVAAAQQLFATLRELDVAQPRQIWVEWPPDTLPWEGVRDRLRRAAASVRTDGPGPGMDD